MLNVKECMCCGACIDVCPQKCISINTDSGFEKIIVDESKCIDCDLCNRICQLESECELLTPQSVYTASLKTNDEIKGSTSGGIAFAISKWFVNNGGIVLGVYTDHNGIALFGEARTVDELFRFRGSKYVYPNTNNLYSIVKELLKDNKVLLIGLPCHIAATRKYIGYCENLFCIDLVCHGAPSQHFFNQHLEAIGICENISNLSFRDGRTYRLLVESNTSRYLKPHYQDNFIYGFLNGLIQKSYCYDCRYSYFDRIGDITLGDSWDKPIKDMIGTNLVLVNSEKGNLLFSAIFDEIEFELFDVDEFKNGTQLKKPVKKHVNRTVFENNINLGFEKASNIALKKELKSLVTKKKFSQIKSKLLGR